MNRAAGTSVAVIALFNVSETQLHSPQRIQIHFIPSDTRSAEKSLNRFCLYEKRDRLSNVLRDASTTSQMSEELTGRVIIVIVIVIVSRRQESALDRIRIAE